MSSRGETHPMTDRRDFIKALGAAALAPALQPLAPSLHSRASLRKLDRIGLQLYTVRHAMEKDVEGTIARVAAIGYREVEFAGYFGKSARDVRALLDKNGLSSPSSHISLSPDQWRAALDAAPVIGHRYLVLAWIPAEERHTLDDYKRWAERLNRAGTEAKAAGLQFAYHNHDFEFAPLDGKLPYDVLLAETDPKLVQLEVDLYWITKGGQDPLAYFARWPGRFPMVHVKDSAGPPDHRIVEVGAGKIDFKKIFAQSDQAGLVCSMGYPTARNDFIATGFNDRANHRMLLRELEETLPLAARHGVPNVIAMFGNRRGKSDAEAIDNCVAGLNQIKAQAEARRVTICLELLNSKVDHADYQGDRTAFGVAVVKAVGSPRVRLLYDIYHMQIMEGDIIRTIRDNKDWIAHFHTGGVPGRHELDGTQELNWHAVAAAIADTGFTGFVAHEFTPTRDPLTSLRQAVETCTV